MIVLYQGARGRGKTLSMVRDAYIYHEKGWKVLRNCQGLSFGDYISNEEVLSLDKNSKLRDCVLFLDEIQIFFDARESARSHNKKFSNFIQQIRKRNIIILSTTQFPNTVEKRFKQHLNVLAFPDFTPPSLCTVTYLDLDSIEDFSIFVTPRAPRFFTISYDASNYFGLYDTNEMIV